MGKWKSKIKRHIGEHIKANWLHEPKSSLKYLNVQSLHVGESTSHGDAFRMMLGPLRELTLNYNFLQELTSSMRTELDLTNMMLMIHAPSAGPMLRLVCISSWSAAG